MFIGNNQATDCTKLIKMTLGPFYKFRGQKSQAARHVYWSKKHYRLHKIN